MNTLTAAIVAIAARLGESVAPARYQYACPAGAGAFNDALAVDQTRGAYIVTGMSARSVNSGNNDLGTDSGTITMKLSQGGQVYVDKVHSAAVMLNEGVEPDLEHPEWGAPIIIDEGGKLLIDANQGAANNFVDGDAINFAGVHVPQRVADLVRLHLGELRAYVLNLSSTATTASADEKQPDEDIIVDKFSRLSPDGSAQVVTRLSVSVDGFELFPRSPKTTAAIPAHYEAPGSLVSLRVPRGRRIQGRQETTGTVGTYVGFLGRTVPAVPLDPPPFPIPAARR